MTVRHVLEIIITKAKDTLLTFVLGRFRPLASYPPPVSNSKLATVPVTNQSDQRPPFGQRSGRVLPQ
jgi:hypothetical protein